MKGTYNVYLKDHHIIDLYLRNSNNYINLYLNKPTGYIDLFIPGASYILTSPKVERMTLFQDTLKLSERMYIEGEANTAVISSDFGLTALKFIEAENIFEIDSMVRAAIANSITVEQNELSLLVSTVAFEQFKRVSTGHTFNISSDVLNTYTLKLIRATADIDFGAAIEKTHTEKSISISHSMGFDSRIVILNYESVGAEGNSLYIGSSVSAQAARYRKLSDMDQYKLSDFDSMTLNDADYVVI